MQKLNNAADFYGLVRSEKILIAEVGSSSCAPCAAVREKLDIWLQAHPEAAAVYIPAEEYTALAAQLGVFAFPAVLVYVMGKIAVRSSGCFSLEEIFQKTERYVRLLNI